MFNSASTGSLLSSRLIPENKIATFNDGKSGSSSSSSSMLKPKLMNSKSTASITSQNLLSGLHAINSNTLSNAASAIVLSPKLSVRNKNNSLMDVDNDQSKGGVSVQSSSSSGGGGKMLSESDRLKNSSTSITAPPSHNRTSFINSLNLSTIQLHELFKVSHSFFYLRCRDPSLIKDKNDIAFNVTSVYDLELITLEQLDKSYYFTLSKEGVTQFRNKVSSFTALNQWEREYRLFHKIAEIRFFKIYKRWKAFTVWRRGLRYGKMGIASNYINSNLFIFNIPLRNALMSVRSMTISLSNMGMLSLPKTQTFDLDDFVRVQAKVHDELRDNLRKLSSEVLSTVRIACDEVVDQFLKSNNIAANHKMTFMERAALRAECKRLTRFLRMMDILISDFLTSMVNEALTQLVAAVESDNLEPRVETFDNVTLNVIAKKREEKGWKTPLFRIIAAFKKVTHKMRHHHHQQQQQQQQQRMESMEHSMIDDDMTTIAEPEPLQPATTTTPTATATGEDNAATTTNATTTSAGAIEDDEVITLTPSVDYLVHAIDGVIRDALEIVGSFVKVLTAPETEMYVMPEGDEEEGEAAAEGVVDIISSIKSSPQYTMSKETIHNHLRNAFSAVKEYLDVFQPYRQLFLKNAENVKDISVLFESGDVESFQNAIAEYRSQLAQFSGVPRYSDVGVVLVDSVETKSSMIPSPTQCLLAIQNYLPELAKIKAQGLVDEVGAMNPILSTDPVSVEAYVNKKKMKDLASAGMGMYNERQSYIRTLVHIMDDNQWSLPDTVKALMRMLKESLLLLESNIQLSEGKEEDETKKFSLQVTEECPKVVKRLSEIRQQLDNSMISEVDAADDKVVKFLAQQENDFQKLKSRCEKLQEYQGILKMPVDEFEMLEEIQTDLNLKIRLWNDRGDWNKLRQGILDTQISNLDVSALEKQLVKFNKTVYLCSKGLPLNKVVPKLKESVDEFNPVLPIILDLRSPCLKERHWEKINNLVGVDVQNSENFTLNDLIQKGVTSYQEEISVISTSAQQEAILEEMMAKVASIWEKQQFDVKPYKDVKDLYVLGDTSEIIAGLDDSLVTINTVLGSRYVSGIRKEVDIWRGKLMHFQETLDEWLTCQRNWMYLETIFGSPDIIRQLPGPAKVFQAVDKSWKHIMKQTNDDPNAINAGTKDKTRRDTFRNHNANLDQIQKDLEDYLETKRMAFPRFYFLSNDELLEILSQAKEPRAVQPHLRKCFDNLVLLEFGPESGSSDILAMFSSEKERVSLGKNLKARGNVEEWLTAVEKKMKESLHSHMKAGLIDYDAKPRDEWIAYHPGQIVATVAQMTWARDTEAALRNENPIAAMLEWSKNYKKELLKLIIKIRSDLTSLVRKVIVALVTTDVHARDIIDELCDREVSDVHDFLWQQQLRYYWEVDIENCMIKHSDAKILYGYEYMGATSRLVITPLTDRCWLTLTGSYALKLGAAPAGPAGTGKTESSKDLAKAIGIQCVVFNCSDQIDYKMMGKLFRGLAQGGSWICLDEFNRIDIEVLSVIAQQLLVLREGRQAKKSNINFMGIQISLVDHHVIITMNPGYAGRTELPDNLAVCFRPVSMMVPNYALIAEIMLFAEGFGDAKNLSRKMCKLYILCSEQLSQQPHYDYGLRAVKSVLSMAGGLKRSNPDLEEDLVLIRALRDSNVPKFLADDLPLFAAIVQDLFPGVEIPSNDYGELQVALEEEIVKAGLQKVPKFIGKVIQMFDIFNIRFGATLVGPAGTGKSTCYQILAALMTNLREKKSPNDQFQKVRYQILNPKSITMGELYGEFNPMTQEWHDGLASSIMREFVAEESDDKRWTIFDGPIDALWIENMNTVLDDNMTLCLANGQRIKLKQEMKCLFEVNDLAVASPATVSRIGVVYMTPTDLGWMPYVQSWIPRALPKGLPSWAIDRILLLFDKTFSKGLTFQRKNCKEPVETVDIQLVISMCFLFQSLFKPENGVDLTKPQGELSSLLDKLFFFCYIWTVGAVCSDIYWEQFNENAREIFEETCPGLGLPGGGMGFDYWIDIKECRFREWSEIVPTFKYDDTVPYFSLMVPTNDTCRFSYVMKSLITVDKPCFITGVTGTGKTVAIQNMLNSLRPMHDEGGLALVPIFMNFSAQTRSDVTQSTIESKLEKKRKNLLGAPSGKKVVVFVDDVNMPLVEEYGAQPPVELLRQFMDFKGFYDRDKLFWKEVVDVLMFAGAAPPGGGRAVVTPRFTRHFNVMCIPPASDAALTLIFSSILNGFLIKFEPEIQKMASGVVAGTIEVYQKISQELLPTPSKFHYSFNLRDISKVFQGVLMIRPRKCPDNQVFSRLWVHECMRIFYDRLINRDDQAWFRDLMIGLCSRHLKMSFSMEDLFAKPIVFADFLKPDADPRFYEEVRDLPKLTAVLSDLLDNYNVTFPTQMNLVFFEDALAHTVRISRILRQPRGNAMLIGVGGSGKQSLTKMASFVGNMACLSIEINRGYGIIEFREDIKRFMFKTGVEGNDTIFLFTDSQIVNETMLEDLNNVLNTGEVANLYAQDETDKICADMIAVCKNDGIPETRDNCLAHFISRVRDKLHIVLCMSPVGDSLRIRCRQFPSLINCTTIDWFHGWPEEALVSVAERFLGELELPSEDIRTSVVRMCGFVHRSIEDSSIRFFNELRRRVYTTPKSYLDLINLYMSMLKGLQDIVEVKSDRMKVGVQKLEETNSIVDALRAELVKLEPVLKQKAIETEALLIDVAQQKAEANIVAEKVGTEEAIVSKQAAETSAVATDAQKDLDRALPALESAKKALSSLTKADITEVKSFANPPAAVRIVMEAVCVLLGEKEAWDNAKKVLGRSDFLEMLQNYDKDNIPESRLKKLRKQYINAEEMQVEVIQKVSKAGTGLCLWARAMDVYADVAKEVAPKQARLDEMKAALDLTTTQLKEKQASLKAVNDKVALLQKTCDDTVAEKQRLQSESDTTAKRLIRAEKLTSGLNSEGQRWKSNIVSLSEEKINLIGDCFLSCACISYYGAFTGTFRNQLISTWLDKANELEIPASLKFSLTSTLGDPVQIREWQNQGLPTDPVSVNNGILVDKCRRWPLMIDPQMQANQWLRKKEEKNNVMITTMRDTNLLRALENCIRLGKPLILEDLGEQLEPALEPVLQKAVFKQGNRTLIRLGDSDVDYDANFRLYMTTKMPNPHYLPEVCIKVTIINFTVTMLGLEAQLLGLVVKAERPDIEQKKVQLLLQMADDKRQLAQLEAKILQMLSESEGNILDDEVLINTLSESKLTSIAIGERVAEAEITEQDINEARGRYLEAATRGSIIYFVIADLGGVDPMYQYSLGYYTGLFSRCIADSEKNPDLSIRLKNIIDYATLVIYQNICRGLFEKDKLLFSSSICFQILRQSGKIREEEWNLFIRGPGAVDRATMPPNPFPDSITSPMWDIICAAETRIQYEAVVAPSPTDSSSSSSSASNEKGTTTTSQVFFPFAGLCESLKKSYSGNGVDSKWATWMDDYDVMHAKLPGNLNDSVNRFQKLILVKALREDKLQRSIAAFVSDEMGSKFAESPNASMEDIYKDLDNKTPCIFVLSSGADPTGMLLRFAKKSGYGDRLSIVSLGQGQGPYAKQLIENGVKTGDWVVLQNCMLAKSWMPELDKIIFELSEKATKEDGGGVNPDFRLYLTSAPAAYFPVSILQNGVKMTNEPPKGFKSNLLRSFANLVKEEDYEGVAKSLQWKKLLTGLMFFHANIQERRKFGPLGWNIRYAFDESDLETSIAVLRRFLEEQEQIPWDALNYVTGHINYGGRVTDDWDRRCLMSILSIYMVPEILTENYSFSKSGTYYAPTAGKMSATISYFDTLPLADDPEVFGMHENANVTFNTNESLALMAAILSLQPRSSGGGSGKTSDDVVIELAQKFESEAPSLLLSDDAGPTTFIIQPNGLLTSLAICLEQEMVKFNRLLNVMKNSLRDIKRAIKGMIVMSSDLDAMYTAFLNNSLPGIWNRASFASLKTLGSWVTDLLFRVKFMRKWLLLGQPAAFPLPVFFFPQGFMTASLQTFARKHMEAIDGLTFKYKILKEDPDSIIDSPEDGVIVFGLYLEGARFNTNSQLVVESIPGKMYDLLPAIHFIPAVGHKQPLNTYACPVYKTAVRKGVLSTTGMSTNYVVPIELPIAANETEQKWILAGVAALCNLTD